MAVSLPAQLVILDPSPRRVTLAVGTSSHVTVFPITTVAAIKTAIAAPVAFKGLEGRVCLREGRRPILADAILVSTIEEQFVIRRIGSSCRYAISASGITIRPL